ncbi:MAG: C40 family peptidase [Bacteroidales bacterium]|nr:C40 family peptidase [Bacteroidales bacterium]MDD2323703.1 C40 family peptidase [Bacteroidales bacterium]MDD3960409.1 C40 family peptidase [Bacteroidales bacterium]MDY0285862.1 C40 family peptidase [Bacteroidales bacterium]
MNAGIIITGVSAVRRQPDHCMEMTNQLLFGEIVTLLEIQGEWASIVSQPDQYPGFILLSHLRLLLNHTAEAQLEKNNAITADWVSIVKNDQPGSRMIVPPGAMLYEFQDKHFRIEKELWTIETQVLQPNLEMLSTGDIRSYSLRFLNTPYLWGGKTPFGLDCSGFTQLVFRMGGIMLRRDAAQQAEWGEIVDFPEEAREADLAFFGEENESISHVGILLDPYHIIHCSGKVRIDNFDHHGIFNGNHYTHKLRLIKRIIN